MEKLMRKNDWTEEKAVNCVKNIFLDNELIHEVLTNDKTEFIDGYVYVSNELNKILDLDIGKIEIQIKGRTNSKSKAIEVKKTFFDYCKASIVPVSIFFVNINADKSVEGIYLKYIDENSIKQTKSGYSVKFTDADIVSSYNIVEHLRNIQNRHLDKIISRLNNSKTYIKDEETYTFVNNVIKGVNGFLYTILNKYMLINFKNLQRFGIIYCLSSPNTITYSIIPIYQGNLCNDIIQVNNKQEIFKLRTSKIYIEYNIEFTDEFGYKLIKKILRKVIIPSILNITIFSKINKRIAKRSLIYHLNIILSKEKNISKLNKYSNEIKDIIASDETIYPKYIIRSIINSNINLIENKLHEDINLVKQHETSHNFTLYSECEDNKFTINVTDNKYTIKNTKPSIYYLLGELLNFIDDNEIIDIIEYKKFNRQFQFISQDDVNKYIQLKYDCICEFCNLYINIQPRQYIWNGYFNEQSLIFSSGGTEYVQVYYSNNWKNTSDKTINSISNNIIDFNKGLMSTYSKALKSSLNTTNHEILVKEIYEEIISILSESIETYY